MTFRTLIERSGKYLQPWRLPDMVAAHINRLDAQSEQAQRRADDITRTAQEICTLMGTTQPAQPYKPTPDPRVNVNADTDNKQDH